MRTHFRRDKAAVLTADEADENVEHLSSVQRLTTNAQLHSGGTYYQSSGTLRHGLPSSAGATFNLTVEAGTATLLGVVDGKTNPTFGPGGERSFRRVDGQWRDVSASFGESAESRYVARTLGGSFAGSHTWMLNAVPATLILPATAAEGDAYHVVRGNALVSVVVEGGGSIIGVDHEAQVATRRSEARIGRLHKRARFVYIGGEWRSGE